MYTTMAFSFPLYITLDEQVSPWEKHYTYKDTNEQSSYADSFCVYSDSNISHLDYVESEVESYCVIDKHETHPPQENTCVENNYGFSDFLMVKSGEEAEFDKSVIEHEETKLKTNISGYIDQYDFDESLISDEQTNNYVELSYSDSELAKIGKEYECRNDDEDHENVSEESFLYSVVGTDEINVSNVAEVQNSAESWHASYKQTNVSKVGANNQIWHQAKWLGTWQIFFWHLATFSFWGNLKTNIVKHPNNMELSYSDPEFVTTGKQDDSTNNEEDGKVSDESYLCVSETDETKVNEVQNIAELATSNEQRNSMVLSYSKSELVKVEKQDECINDDDGRKGPDDSSLCVVERGKVSENSFLFVVETDEVIIVSNETEAHNIHTDQIQIDELPLLDGPPANVESCNFLPELRQTETLDGKSVQEKNGQNGKCLDFVSNITALLLQLWVDRKYPQCFMSGFCV